jgi:hypothetical protein
MKVDHHRRDLAHVVGLSISNYLVFQPDDIFLHLLKVDQAAG